MKTIGVLLVNLGTPNAPTPSAVKKYLAEFLSDPRVIEIPRIPWKLILHGFILNIRPKASAKKYQIVWTDEGSPLLAITKKQATALRQVLPEHYCVEIAMRYGSPSIAAGIDALLAKAVDQIVIFPLYPQYCAATTATVFDKVAEALMKKRYFPALKFLGDYSQNRYYLKACAEHLTQKLVGIDYNQIVFSYHGMPKATYDKGDPYYERCVATSKCIAEEMGLTETAYQTVFQSRFGKAQWLQPYAYQYLAELPRQGINNVAVFCPGFSADCLETIEEMGMENRDVFLQAGGKHYHFIPCLNDEANHIAALKNVLLDQ